MAKSYVLTAAIEQCPLPVIRNVNSVALFTEPLSDEAGQLGLVFAEQDPHIGNNVYHK